MNEKEVSELRRRLRPDKNNISHVCGCYVNDQREIVSLFSQSLTMMAQEEAEAYLALLKKCLSGTLGKNLIDISFATRQVADGDEHRLLMALRSTELRDRGVVEDFCRKIIEGLAFEGSYLILLAQDAYDVPYHTKDGERQDDASEEVIRGRLDVYRQQTAVVSDYYAAQGKYASVNGTGTMDDVFARITDVIAQL